MRHRGRGLRIALAASLAVAAVACGGDDDEETSGNEPAPETTAGGGADTTTAPDAEDGEVDPDAVVRVGWVGPADGVDPHRLRAIATQPYVFLLYDRLTRIDENLEVQPMLAESWEFAPDGTYLEMALRDDVTFHDGNPVDAEAVKASIERAQTIEGSTVKAALSSISQVEVIDPQTVRFHLSSGGAQLPTIFSGNAGVIISPAAIADGRDLVLDPGDAGSGPYILTSIAPPDSATFEPAPGEHWDERASRTGGFDIRFIPDFSARLNALQSGQLDFISAAGVDQVQGTALGEQDGFDAITVDTATTFVILMRTNEAPLDDPDLRQAMTLAIDRDAFAEDFLQGFCVPTNQPYPPGHPLHDDGVPIVHDPDEASSLVEAMGGATLDLITVASSTFEPPSQVLQSQLNEVGIDTSVRPLPTSDFVSLWGQGEGDALFVGILGYPTASQLVQDSFLGGYFDGGTVPTAEEARVAELAATGIDPTATDDERDGAYREIFGSAAEDNWIIPICTQRTSWVFSDQLLGVEQMDGQSSVAAAGSIPDLRTLGIAAEG